MSTRRNVLFAFLAGLAAIGFAAGFATQASAQAWPQECAKMIGDDVALWTEALDIAGVKQQ